VTEPRSQPNILIFCTDEQCGDHLSCMGHPDVKTPHIDRIAAEGTLFRNCYSSNPVCMPARATMVTGLTSRVHGVVNNGFDLDRRFPTLPGMLADAGYRTHAVGKLHLAGRGGREITEDEDVTVHPERRIYWDWPGHWEGAVYKEFPDNYFGFQSVELAQGHVHYIYGDYVTWLEDRDPGVYTKGYKSSNADPHPLAIDPELHYNTWIADRSIAFIKGLTDRSRQQSTAVDSNRSPDGDSPFFLWCSFPDPHEPFAAVEKWSEFYDGVDIELSENSLALSPESRSSTMTALGLGTEVYDPEFLKKAIKQTYGMVSHVDEQVGRVLDCLEEQGIADDTVVMFISDHGDQLGEHGLLYKSVYPYNRHAHIPFIAKVPGGERGKVVEDVVSMLDMVPTALDLAGLSQDLPGEVLTPVLMSAARPIRKNALVEHDRTESPIGRVEMRSLVRNDYKLVHYPCQEETLLFDRANDPQELKNLAGDPEMQPMVAEMFKELRSELARTEMPAHH
jgi:arylsulfatase A-like enzyme